MTRVSKVENKIKQSLRSQILWNQICGAAIHLLISVIFRLTQRNAGLELKNYLIDFTTQSANHFLGSNIHLNESWKNNLFQYPARPATKHVTWWSLAAEYGYFFPYHLFVFAHECILNEYIYQEHSEGSQGESKEEMKPLHLLQFNIQGNNTHEHLLLHHDGQDKCEASPGAPRPDEKSWCSQNVKEFGVKSQNSRERFDTMSDKE